MSLKRIRTHSAVVIKRPLPVTIISCIILAAGLMGLFYHMKEFNPKQPLGNDVIWVLFVRALAIICGVHMLRGRNWARWLTLCWMAYHVILSSFHSWSELATHSLLFAVFAFCLSRPSVTRYFHAAPTSAT